MGLWDIFTGAPVKAGADKSRSFLGSTLNNNNSNIDYGLNSSLAAIGQGYGDYRPALTSGYNAATGAVNSGYDAAKAGYAAAASPLSDLAGKYGGATSLALNALGVNGADASSAARSAFSAGPAYNFNLDQGLEAINRRRAAGGMLNSGNADRDAQTFGAGLASNEYDKWMQQLLGFTNPELGATANAAAINARGANMEADRGQMLASLANSYGTNLGNSYINQGNQTANLWQNATGQKVNAANSIAAPYASTYGQQADAQMQGSKNIWGLGQSLATLGSNAMGSGWLGNMFGSGSGAAAANNGVAGGGYYGTGGNLYAGPGYYGR